MNVFLQPGAAGLMGVGHELPDIGVGHLAPIGAHAIDHIRAGGHQRAEPLLALTEGLARLDLVRNVDGVRENTGDGAVRLKERLQDVVEEYILDSSVSAAVKAHRHLAGDERLACAVDLFKQADDLNVFSKPRSSYSVRP